MTLLESLPSVENCAGGVVQDYRLDALREIVHDCRLQPVGQHGPAHPVKRKSRDQLVHETRYFPLVRSEAVALEHPLLASLTDTIRAEAIDRISLDRCQEHLTALFEAASRNDSEYFPELKKSARRLGYTELKRELKEMAEAYGTTSPNHGSSPQIGLHMSCWARGCTFRGARAPTCCSSEAYLYAGSCVL